MPVEKFYPSVVIEGEAVEVLEVSWPKDGEYEKVWVVASERTIEDEGIALQILAFDLDRSGLNRLIKALRRARNATFGVDE